MKFLSPEDDFAANTLAGVPGCLAKADYLLNLQNENGALSHWGLERSYGVDKARVVIRKACSRQLQELLRKSLRELWGETEDICRSRAEAVQSFISRLRKMILLSANEFLREPQVGHLNSVLDALSELAANRQPSLGASPTQQPGQ
jgi:hypothetical protein